MQVDARPVSLPGSLRRSAVSVLSGAQAEGAAFLYRGIPRSFLLLMGAFLVVYALYWGAAFGGMSAAGELLVHVLGLLVGIVLAITVMKLWPRLEQAVPRWFRVEVESPALHRPHKYLAWTGALLVVALCAVFVIEITFATVMLMGLIGGAYILFRLEGRIFQGLGRLRSRHPGLWRGGWSAFLVLLAVLVLLIAIVTAAAGMAGSNEDPVTHEVKALPTLMVVIPAIALAVHALVLAAFVLVQAWRAWMSWRRRRGKAYGPYRTALLSAHPTSLAFYLAAVNYATGAFFFTYALMLVLQAIAEAHSRGMEVSIDVAGSLLSGQAMDYVALLSFVIAWVALLLNLSGTAVREERRFLNRRVFASLSVFFIMVLFIHVIAARGDEFTISVAFRAMYLTGIALAPLLITWRRWRSLARGEGAADLG